MSYKVNWVKHLDQETGAEMELLQFQIGTEDFNLESIMKHNEDLIYNIMYSNIEYAIFNKLKHVAFIAIEDFVFEITEDLYKSKLEHCLKHFQKPEIEQYEKCANIIELLKML